MTATSALECQRAAESAPCLMQPTVEAHTRSLDSAHVRLREHGGQIVNLTTQTAHQAERLVRVESATGDNHRLMLKLQGSIEGLRVEQVGIRQSLERLADTEQSSHELLIRHMDQSRADAEVAHASRLAQVERVSMWLIKIAAAITMLVGFMAMIYSVLAGRPLLSLFTGAV